MNDAIDNKKLNIRQIFQAIDTGFMDLEQAKAAIQDLFYNEVGALLDEIENESTGSKAFWGTQLNIVRAEAKAKWGKG